jgi:hypothetical protein
MSESGEIGPRIEQVEPGPKKITDTEIVNKFPDDWKFMDDLSLELDSELQRGETGEAPTVDSFIGQATKEQSGLGESPPEVEEVIAALRETDEMPEATKAPGHRELSGLPIYEPALQESDYHHRARALIETVDKWREDPESIGFENLEDIFTGEEKDLKDKEAELREKKTYPIYADWFLLEHNRLDYLKKITGLMKNGETIVDEDARGAVELSLYLHEKLNVMEDGESDALNAVVQIDDELEELQKEPDGDPKTEEKIENLKTKKAAFDKLIEIADDLIPIFKVFERQAYDYPTEDDWDDYDLSE